MGLGTSQDHERHSDMVGVGWPLGIVRHTADLPVGRDVHLAPGWAEAKMHGAGTLTLTAAGWPHVGNRSQMQLP